ncbi:M48 family metalloprotease, partial [Rickettsiales bacterium]|nr:M48 family metalloprotease [Rickettsiales bacterium]MDB2550563.1 M48 family metalloprotease [Rickettsiales bacterium]
IFIAVIILFNSKSFALSIIRDGEIENFLQKLANPLIKEAGLESKNIKIYIVNNNIINAFVSGGQNIFIHSGLITKYNDPNILRGVLAHEIGHIAAGHLARGSEEMKKAQNIMMLTYLAGILSAATSGSDAGYAMLMTGNQLAERIFLKYNRSQEEAADILALQYLKKTNHNPLGLLTILKLFKSQMSGQDIIDEYALTHPISQKRINFIKANLSQFSNASYNKILTKDHYQMQRIISKLKGFLDDIKISLKETKDKKDFYNLYQRSIALFRSGQIQKSLQIIDQLLIENPKDAYLLELKGQILYESGDIKNAIIFYKKSLNLNKNNFLAKMVFAKAILDLNSEDPQLINIAIKNLKLVLFAEKENLLGYKLLSKSYNNIGDIARENLTLAQYYLLQKDTEKAKEYAKKAKTLFNEDDQNELLKIRDIIKLSNIDKSKTKSSK